MENLDRVAAETVQHLKKVLGEQAVIVVIVGVPDPTGDDMGVCWHGDSSKAAFFAEFVKYKIIRKMDEDPDSTEEGFVRSK